MLLPPDIPSGSSAPTAAPSSAFPEPGDLIDAPPISPQQREDDFNKVFAWRGQEITFSIASELYYRELRAHMNAPALGSYQTLGDFQAEAPRVLYCASHTAAQLRSLRLLLPEIQVARYDAWVEANIALHELEAAAEVASAINTAIARARSQPALTGDGELDGMGNSPAHP